MSILSSRKIFDLINGKFAHIRLLQISTSFSSPAGLYVRASVFAVETFCLWFLKKLLETGFCRLSFFLKPLTLGKTYLIQRQDNSVDNCHRGSEAVKLEQSPAVPVLYPILFVLSPFFQSLNVWVFFFMQGYHAFTIKNSAGIKELKVFE